MPLPPSLPALGLSRSDPDSPSSFAEALLGREHNSKSLQQFLQHGGEVLRFYMLWDNRDVQFGERHMYKLHFFVADATVRRQRNKRMSWCAATDSAADAHHHFKTLIACALDTCPMLAWS
jgi:hypothetical protein